MYKTTTSVRVRYAETDQMGVVYYGNYAQYFEVGRVEMLRDLGITYRKMEDDGVMLPVVSLNVNYKKSALYDDLLTVETELIELPGVKIEFKHSIFNEEKELLVSGSVTLVFIDMKTNKIRKAPQGLLDKLSPFF